MGMNIVSKACEAAFSEGSAVRRAFPGLRVVSLSGNTCADKKAAAVNAIAGRGRSVVADAVVPGAVLRRVLGTGVADALALERLCARKCWLGSGLAGAGPGGLNAQAANVVAAIFLATGQDCAQVVSSSNCVTSMEAVRGDGDGDGVAGSSLLVSCSMPSLEIGTVGGGTRLDDQRACLRVLGVSSGGDDDGDGKHGESSGDKFARIICATVLAAELSLLSALSTGQLVSAHMRLNRSTNKMP
jgi:hydroxymethylglutaryl-CoA reductase (NADPH)